MARPRSGSGSGWSRSRWCCRSSARGSSSCRDCRLQGVRRPRQGRGTGHGALPASPRRIPDRNGEPLAETVAGMMIVADPPHPGQRREDRADPGRQAGPGLLRGPREAAKTSDGDLRFVYLARRVPTTVARSHRRGHEGRLQGSRDPPDPVRTYPANDVAANLLGYLGTTDKPLRRPRARLQEAAGRQGRKRPTRSAAATGSRSATTARVEPVDGKDLTLTIDRDVQWYAQRVLRTAVENAKAESGRRGRPRLPDRRDARRSPTTRRSTRTTRKAPKEDLGSRALQRRLRARLGGEGADHSSLIDAGKVTPRTRFTVPREAARPRPDHRRLVRPRAIRLTLAGVLARSPPTSAPRWPRASSSPRSCGSTSTFRPRPAHRRRGCPGRPEACCRAAETWPTLTRAQIAFGQGLSVNALQMAPR